VGSNPTPATTWKARNPKGFRAFVVLPVDGLGRRLVSVAPMAREIAVRERCASGDESLVAGCSPVGPSTARVLDALWLSSCWVCQPANRVGPDPRRWLFVVGDLTG
jgi:hypothetical protein